MPKKPTKRPAANGAKPARKGRRAISIETKAEMVALLPAMGSASAVAAAFGVAVSVVTRAAANPAVAKLANMKKAHIADKFGEVLQRLLDHFVELADKATLDDKGLILLGIAADKYLLYTRHLWI
jgi:hypothetical protein